MARLPAALRMIVLHAGYTCSSLVVSRLSEYQTAHSPSPRSSLYLIVLSQSM